MPVNISIFSSPKAPSTYAAERLESKPSGEWELRDKPNCADPIQVDGCRGRKQKQEHKLEAPLPSHQLVTPANPPA